MPRASAQIYVDDPAFVLAGTLETADSLAAEARSALGELRRVAANVEGVTGADEWRTTLVSAEATLASLERSSAGLEETVGSLNTVLGRIERGEVNVLDRPMTVTGFSSSPMASVCASFSTAKRSPIARARF